MKKKAILLSLLITLLSLSANATEEQERIYLTQMLNQLNALKPLIVSAAREQPRDNRTQFHYTHFRDANGKTQNGLLEDINEIEKGILEKLDHTPSAPHSIQPIKGDFIDHNKESKTAW
ncbi:MAG: RAQPRD family integrative conjugative element protein [Gammaproteobacteria bacterium]